jgi:hypothetical protein
MEKAVRRYGPEDVSAMVKVELPQPESRYNKAWVIPKVVSKISS